MISHADLYSSHGALHRNGTCPRRRRFHGTSALTSDQPR
nr:MAG TPA: hypothetical protein [Caudoviricetes sp.]